MIPSGIIDSFVGVRLSMSAFGTTTTSLSSCIVTAASVSFLMRPLSVRPFLVSINTT
jgi:hypothetical protein